MNYHLPGFLIIGCLSFLYVKKCEGKDNCPESKTTAKNVLTCPESAKEWREAASRFNCQNFANNCSSFVYHCVMNHDSSEFIEVCAPNVLIVGRRCSEYNYLGERVQAKSNVTCYNCPLQYNSSEIYQFSECFKKHNSTNLLKSLLKNTKTEEHPPINSSNKPDTFGQLYQIDIRKNGKLRDALSTQPQNMKIQYRYNRIIHDFVSAIYLLILVGAFFVWTVRLLQRKKHYDRRRKERWSHRLKA